MNILGLNCQGHDASAAVIKNGRLISAISSERITRKKKDPSMTKEVIEYVLENAELEIDDIDHITISDYIREHSSGIVDLLFNETEIEIMHNAVFYNNYSIIDANILGRKITANVLPHHLSHASSAYFTSPFNEAACLTVDGSCSQNPGNSMIHFGKDNKLNAIESPNINFGMIYGYATQWNHLGSGLHKAGSLMGLSSYGNPSQEVVDNIEYYINLAYDNVGFFSREYVESWYKEFKKWANEKDICYLSDDITTHNGEIIQPAKSFGKIRVAANIQYIFEQVILDTVNNKMCQYETDNICLAGGSFLNCNINSLIKEQTRFKNVHLFPACSDDGNAVGSALYLWHHLFDNPKQSYEPRDIIYLGRKYKYVEPDYEYLAKKISQGKIVAWFMGASEFGPRALGARSIIADPRVAHNKEILNFIVKNREWFRPFAPVVLEEEVHEWFYPGDPSPFMLMTQKVLQPEKIPAVTHVDGSARIQTINEETNMPYYKLVKEFGKLTGVPVLINTSLNGNGQPIVETEQDALDLFTNNESFDILVLNGKIIER